MVEISDGDYSAQNDRLAKVFNRLMSVDPLFYELLSTYNLYVSKSIAGIIEIPTACTFSNNIVFNPDFIDIMDDIEMLSVLDHENNHIIRGDTSYNDRKVPIGYEDIKNQAMDYVINYRILHNRYFCNFNNVTTSVREKYKARLPVLPNGGHPCYDVKYNEKWDWRRVYDDLISSGAKPKQTIDIHLTQGDLDKLAAAGIKIEPLSKSEIASKVFNAIQRAKNVGSGSIPDYLRELVDDLTEPQLDYYDILYGIIENQIKTNASWLTPKKKVLDMGYYLPDCGTGLLFKAGMFFDLSGSIGQEEINKFASEYFGLINQLQDFELHLGCFSDTVHQETYKVFTKDDFDAEDYKFNGCGGTDLSCVTDFLKSKDVKLDNLIVLTDGCTNKWPDPKYCDNLIIICTTDIVAPVGRTFNIKL